MKALGHRLNYPCPVPDYVSKVLDGASCIVLLRCNIPYRISNAVRACWLRLQKHRFRRNCIAPIFRDGLKYGTCASDRIVDVFFRRRFTLSERR